ncbi:MAG: vWA domain-containing protein, partial [Rhodospirillaceae bacterium]
MNQRAVRSLVPVRLLGALMGAVALMLAIVTPSHAQDRRPLLMEGKTELFQRVLTRPGASIAPAIGADGVDPVQPFTPFYVYQRHPVDGGGTPWLEVGLDAKGAVSGYLKASETVAWDHALVMAFTERVNRQRALFFDQDADLKSWLTAPDLLIKADQARRAIDGNALPADSPVVSIEPRQVVDFESNFYMLPVLQAQTVLLPSRKRVRIVEVASVTVAEDPVSRAEASEQKPVGPPVVVNRRMTPDQIEQGLADFRAGVVFVIDASSSMGPYIAQTRAVMDRVLSRVEQAGLADKVRFGLVAYRDDPATVSGIDYLTKTFADPNTVRGAGDFAQAIQPLEASNVSTRAFAEDAFAAVNTAFREIDWSDFGARYVILVTDASARTARAEQVNGKIVPASDTGLDVAAMHKIVRANKAALYTLHLKTPVGKADHDRAQRQYRQLSAY